ncbi:aldehyde dehydrogenase family protein [Amycolatopsis methanolica]|uniref:aldehyde dehydrogenase family protein n=1 Tax=Amycolatopsis methanolica TaxID=1814 RepID=UPI003424ECA7
MSEFSVVDPSSGEMIAKFENPTDADIEAQLGAAHAAFPVWAALDAGRRAEVVARLGELHLERRDELAAIIGREMGKPAEQALGEVDFSAAIYRYYADNAEQFLADEPIDLLDGAAGSAVVHREALGVVMGIMPWNYPYYQVARFAAPNLALGNAVILKPAPQCPESALAIQEMVTEAGATPGAYSTVLATNDQALGIVADPRVVGVSLTGSERAGAAVAEVAGRNLKKVVLELGGSDPFILLGTDDLDATVDAAVAARLENAGQACNAAKRFIVVDELYDSFLTKFTDKLLAAEVAPLSSEAAARRLAAQVRQAVDDGAELTCRGRRDGAYHPPAILTDIPSSSLAYREEFFGPVAAVHRVDSEDAAVVLANDTPFGLGSYVYTRDPEQGRRVARRLDAGMVFINAAGAEGAELPFGGIKRSGFGRELGRYGIDEFVNKKVVREIW